MSAIGEFKSAQSRVLERYRVDAESHFFEVPSVSGRVHALISGDGPPVVMVPGFGDPAAMWAPLMAHLAGSRLYAVDRPSFGLSGSASHGTARLRRLAIDFLEQVLDALELERPLIVANSMGSLWSIWFGLARPERVAAMVHIGCPAFLLGTSAILPMRLLSIRPLGRLLMKLSPPSARQAERFSRMVGENLAEAPEIRDLLVAAQRLPGAQEAILDLLHSAVRLRGPRPGIALSPADLRELRSPALFVWGSRDPFGSPAIGEEAARLIPHARLIIIPDGGHVPWIAHSAEVGAVVRPFLQAEWRRQERGSGSSL